MAVGRDAGTTGRAGPTGPRSCAGPGRLTMLLKVPPAVPQHVWDGSAADWHRPVQAEQLPGGDRWPTVTWSPGA